MSAYSPNAVVSLCAVASALIFGIFIGYAIARSWKIKVRVWPFEITIRGRSTRHAGFYWRFRATITSFEFDPRFAVCNHE